MFCKDSSDGYGERRDAEHPVFISHTSALMGRNRHSSRYRSPATPAVVVVVDHTDMCWFWDVSDTVGRLTAPSHCASHTAASVFRDNHRAHRAVVPFRVKLGDGCAPSTQTRSAVEQSCVAPIRAPGMNHSQSPSEYATTTVTPLPQSF